VSGMWQPIETAPKDGSEVLLYVRGVSGYDHNTTVSAFWGEIDWKDNAHAGCTVYGDITHWMPLPDPPE
jgi:hypothetical protein